MIDIMYIQLINLHFKDIFPLKSKYRTINRRCRNIVIFEINFSGDGIYVAWCTADLLVVDVKTHVCVSFLISAAIGTGVNFDIVVPDCIFERDYHSIVIQCAVI